MTNAELFREVFNEYATYIWSLSEDVFLKWLNEKADSRRIIIHKDE